MSNQLPPRCDSNGLPPRYLAHLRTLLHQWLQQQFLQGDKSWSTDRLAELERAIWEGAVLTHPAKDSQREHGLLEQDWKYWVKGSAARKRLWHDHLQKQQAEQRAREIVCQEKERGKGKGSRKSPLNEADRGRLGIPSSLQTVSPASTPSRQSTRASSIVSADRQSNRREAEGSLTSRDKDKIRHENIKTDDEKQLREWCQVVSTLEGFQKLSMLKGEDWEDVNVDFFPKSTIQDIPGAFPQSGLDHPHTFDISSSAPSNAFSELGLPSDSPSKTQKSIENVRDLIKPIVCLHFPSSDGEDFDGKHHRVDGSLSTIRLRRDLSLSHRSSSSINSTHKRWWSSSGSKWSDLLPDRHTEDELIQIDFVEGQFALPTSVQESPRGSLRIKRRSSHIGTRRHSLFSALQTVPTSHVSSSILPSIASTPDDCPSSGSDTEIDDGDSTAWSGTQHDAHRDRKGMSLVISGAEDDIPRQEAAEGKIGVVGGTVVILGLTEEEDKRAVGRVMELLIYTITTMTLELDLLDAFQIPREPYVPPLLSKSPYPNATFRQSMDLLTRDKSLSLNEKKEKMSFLARLGKDTKGVFEGLLGRNRSLRRKDHSRNRPSSVAVHISPPLAILENPSISPQPISAALSEHNTTNQPYFSLFNPDSVPSPNNHHLVTLETLQKLIHSTTPGMVFPMPAILLRVKEDRIRREKAELEMRDPSEVTIDVSSGIGTKTKLELGTTIKDDPLRGRALAYRPGGQLRSGLNSLANGLDTFDGWIRLQRLFALYCVLLPPSQAHDHLEREEKRDERGAEEKVDETDVRQKEFMICQAPRPYPLPATLSIFEYLHSLQDELDEENLLCPRIGCGAEGKDHTRLFLHAGVQISVKVTDFVVKPAHDGKDVRSWVECCICRQKCNEKRLSEAAGHYPWGKLLELLIYTTILQPPICPHASSQHTFIHCFRTSSFTVNLSASSLDLFDMRFPKLQVGPNVTKRKGDKEWVLGTFDELANDEAGHTIKEKEEMAVTKDIHAFYDTLDTELGVLRKKSEKEHEITRESETDTKGLGLQETLDTLSSLSASFATSKSFLVSSLTVLATTNSMPSSQLNDIRIAFVCEIEKALTALEAWQKKYMGQSELGEIKDKVPEYAKENGRVHALPGSRLLIKEDEPASVIAYTLSSLAYFAELTKSRATGDSSHTQSPVVTVAFAKNVSVDTSTTSAITTDPVTSASTATHKWTTKIEQRDSPRDILSLRSIVKVKSDASMALDKSKSAPSPVSLTNPIPSTEVSLEQVEGVSEQGDRMEEIVKTISRATGQDQVLSSTTSHQGSLRRASLTESDKSSISYAWSAPRGQKRDDVPPSSFRLQSGRSVSSSGVMRHNAPSTSRETRFNGAKFLTVGGTPSKSSSLTINDSGWGSVTSSLANSVSSLWKFGSEVGETISSIRMRGTDRSLQSFIGPLSSMDNSLSMVEPRPHLHFTYILPDRLRLSCVVYFAQAFDSLRRRCAVDKIMVESLARTDVWDAQGGKSKAGFWMTRDKRFIVKELVSKWIVSDMHALLEISPAYFHFMAGTHNKATSLAKIVGFYTVTIKDLQSGQKRQLNLLVMENLFYNQNIVKTFDLKGIEGRRLVKKTDVDGRPDKVSKTLFDADWLEGIQKKLILFQPHAKRILLDAISLDTKFLSSQSIMDYSLLIGVDVSSNSHSLIVGLVDAIGSFNLFKTIESRGKMALNRGGDVTIIPPNQYRQRFQNAIKHYFIACPDKWSKFFRNREIYDVPSIL
ncbi:uncharacterized protein L203_104263 [Cryptococcus depauperatus CBS 7841]|uniref:PIPK domain-containing protein n=1 Tax=Cryptococcus depauperatus CBS 7841 TaxID=1295531 RepID=A0AAJ8JV68_9TREE